MPSDAKPNLTPKLRFPEFRDKPGWNDGATSDIAVVLQGYGFPEKHQGRRTGELPFYKVSDISRTLDLGSHYIDEAAHYIDQQTLKELKAKTIPEGTTIFAKIGEALRLNKRVITTKPCVIDNNTAGVKAIEGKATDLFLYYLWLTVSLEDHAGGVVPAVNKSAIESIPVLYPSSPEQQKIASCLSTLDELIGAENQKLDALQSHKKGLMQQIFPREGETLPRLRFPEFQNAPEWEDKTLSDACRMQAGKFVAASDIKEQPADGLFPCYGGNGLRGYTQTYTHEGRYPLIGRQGALCGNVKLGGGKFHATEHALVATAQQGVDESWLYYVLDFLNLNRFATGQAQPGLSVDVLEKIPVAIPKEKNEQERIATCLSSLDDLITAQGDKVEALKTHKKGLMQGLFPSTAEEEA